jgi:aminomethyltransferase
VEGASVEDRSDEYALLALQGRKGEALLSRIVKRDMSTLKYYEFTWVEMKGTAALISRTGYTGEDGFEIYLPTGKGPEMWDLLLREGQSEGLVPVGLGARDTLRLEMGYLLNGSDMSEDTTALEVGLSWIVKLDKGNFVGRDVLVRQKEEGLTRRIRALKATDRGIPRPHYEVRAQGRRIGEITSGTFSPSLKVGVALAMVEAGTKVGDAVAVMVRDREVPAVVVAPPFVSGSVKK